MMWPLRFFTPWYIGIALIAGLGLIQIQFVGRDGVNRGSQELMYLPDGRYLEMASLGYRQLMADVLWIQAIQVMGDHKVSQEAGHWLFRIFDLITTLDPKFVRVYEAGGIALCTLTVLPEESNRLLKKGMAHNPEEWRLPFLIGINMFYEFSEDAKAAEYIARASRLPGAPENLAPLAANLYAIGKSPQQAVELLASIYESTTDESMRKFLELRVKELIVERDLQILEQAVSRYQTQYGNLPDRIEDLVDQGVLTALPVEPFGGRYIYNSRTGVVRSTEVAERIRFTGHRRGR